MIYHLAKYPVGHLSVWSTDEEWAGSIVFEKVISSPHHPFLRKHGISKWEPKQKNAESTFFMSQFVIFSSEDMNEIIEHASFAVLEEKVVARDD